MLDVESRDLDSRLHVAVESHKRGIAAPMLSRSQCEHATVTREWCYVALATSRDRPSAVLPRTSAPERSMKILLVLRHAKTQSDAPAGDHARELTKRGRRDAAAMGDYIRTLIGMPDAMITSDATRARQTAEIVATAVDFAAPLTVEPRIYAADVDTLLAEVRRIPDEVRSAIIIGHNPGFEELAGELAGNHDPGIRLPTSGLALFELDVERWDAARADTARLREVATPRTIA